MNSQSLSGFVQILTKGAIAVYYFGRIIALIDDRGDILWRDEGKPLFLIEYLIEHPAPQSVWN